ncbi:MAG: methylaspartate mutase subunit S [Clostridia bacterium]|nr:methylaspartate mutase subunit S [Clostridia bacterium]
MMNKTLVLGVIGADVHSVGNKILEYALNLEGFNVVNLGVMVSQQEFIDAAVETAADAILVSSLYGHGELDCKGLREKCEEAGIGNILMYAGGNLVVGKTPFEEVEKRFLDMGFDRVFPPGTLPQTGIDFLRKDLGLANISDGGGSL